MEFPKRLYWPIGQVKITRWTANLSAHPLLSDTFHCMPSNKLGICPFCTIFQLVEMSWSCQPIMVMKRQLGLKPFDCTLKRAVSHHPLHGWRDILHHSQNGHFQSPVLQEVILLGRHQTQPPPRALVVPLVYIHRYGSWNLF